MRSVKSGTLCTVLISGVFYTLLMLVGIAATVMPDVADSPQAGWFTIMSDYGGTWLLGLGITIVFAASMGHIDGSVQVCGLQIANDLVNTTKRPLTDKRLTQVAKTSMLVFMIAAGVVAYATFNMTRLQLLAQISYQGSFSWPCRCSWASSGGAATSRARSRAWCRDSWWRWC